MELENSMWEVPTGTRSAGISYGTDRRINLPTQSIGQLGLLPRNPLERTPHESRAHVPGLFDERLQVILLDVDRRRAVACPILRSKLGAS